MCGIALITDHHQRIDRSSIQRMVKTLHHRGPDACGIEETPGCWLGHTRLQVIDPTGGSQPMWDDSGRYCIVFNGEIFNFQRLRQELRQLGHAFATQSDTEVALLAFRQWGPDFLKRLNGQFAIAIWDAREQSLFAARDRLGEKPLFWAQTKTGELIIGSELKAILAADLFTPEICLSSVDVYLKLIYVPSNRTIYQNVHSLAPGHQLLFRKQDVSITRYWQPQLATASGDAVDATEAGREIRRLLEQSVQRQMVADTDVGAFLSGGLDSSSIVALMMQGKPTSSVKTFAVGFGDLIDELPFAREVAGRYQTDHAELQMDIEVGDLLSRMTSVYDQPFGDSSNIPTYLVSEFASRHVKVVLSGDGGDELFGGYSWYTALLERDSTSDSRSSQLAWWALSRLTAGALRRRAKEKARAILHCRQRGSVWQQHLEGLTIQTDLQRQQLWQRTLGITADEMLRTDFSPSSISVASENQIDQAVDFDLRCYLPGDIFAKVDRAAMAHGLETRCPFMDVELVEFVLSLPPRLRFCSPEKSAPTRRADKRLLRLACQELWPKSVAGRSKQGFGAPVKQWLERSDVREMVDRVQRPGGPLRHLLPGLSWHSVEANNPPQAQWNLLCLGLWLEKHQACLSHL